jgi:predicted Zn-dependent peptidase
MKKNLFVALTLLLTIVCLSPAQIDRSKVPGPGPAPAVAFPDYDLVTTANGMRVIIVKNSELPTISIRMLIDRKPVLEKEYAGCLDVAGQLLRTGTTTRTKDQLDEEIDLIGGNIGSGETSVYASGLSKNTEKLFELMADVTLHPSFPLDELEKILTQTKSGLKYRKTEPSMIADVIRQKIIYGDNHPYGEIETEETIGKITRERCMEMYKTYFKANYALMAVVGDVDKEKVMNLVGKYFGAWQQGPLPEPKFDTPKQLDKVQVAFVDRPSSVQSVIRVTQTVDLQRTSPDVLPVEVMNTVLGGGIFRLFINLREKHAYTYGAYSSMGPDELIGYFTASTSTKNAVTDSAITEIFYEINRIRNEKVEAKELQMAKNFLSGAFVRSLEQANTIAGRAIDIERFKLPKDYYKTYLKRLDAITADNVQQAATKYLAPDKMLVDVVGSAKDVKDKLSKFGAIDVYDEDGNKIVEKPAAPITITADEIFAKFIDKTGGQTKMKAIKDKTIEMSGKMQNIEIKLKSVQKAPNKLYLEMNFVGMFQQKQGYDGKHGWAVTPQGTIDLSGDQLTGMKYEAVINFYDQYKTMGLKAEVSGIKNLKGKDYYEVSFIDSSGSSMRQYFSVDDFLKFRDVKSINTPRGPIDQVTDYYDYKDFSGYLVATRLEQNVMGQTMDLKLEKFEVNKGVSGKIFNKPK